MPTGSSPHALRGMVDRPSHDSSGPRIRQAPSLARSGEGSRQSKSNRGYSARSRTSYEDDDIPLPNTNTQRRHTGRLKRAKAESISARRAWMAALFAVCIYLLKRAPGATGPAALYDAILEKRNWEHDLGTSYRLSVEIFAAPKPFIGHDAEHQTRAIESWLALNPCPKVTLLGTGEGYDHVVRTYGLNWRKDVDTSFLGVPLFSAIVAAANESQADVAVIANSDIMFFDDFTFAIQKINRDSMGNPWMLLGARWDIPYVPRKVLRIKNSRRVRSNERDRRKMVRWARENGTLHTYGGIDVWAWNTNAGAGLYDGTMPHFVFGRGKYDNWFTHEVISAGHRKVVDASEACTFVHVLHDHHLVTAEGSANPDVADSASAGGNRSRRALLSATRATRATRAYWNEGARVKFELYVNTYLAAAHGTYTNQMGTILHAPFKMQSCYEEEGLCLFVRKRPNSCRCEHSTFVRTAQSDPFVLNDTKMIFCGLQSSDSLEPDASDRDTLSRFVISGRKRAYVTSAQKMGSHGLATTDNSYVHSTLLNNAGSGSKIKHLDKQGTEGPFGLPLLLPGLLDVVEHQTGERRIVLTMLNSNHKSLLQRFVCAARRAGVFQSLIVAALDDETYHFAITRGIAVYLEETVYKSPEEETEAMGAQFASPGLNILISLRGRVTKKVVDYNFQVFYADPDVMLQANPFGELPQNISEVAVLGYQPVAGSANLGGGVQSRAFSTAMLYARPGKVSSLFLGQIAQLSGEQTLEKLLKAAEGTKYAILPPSKYIDAVTEVPEEAGESVAIHVGAPGEAHTKLEVISRSGLDLYDDLLEVCRILHDEERKWRWPLRLLGTNT